MYTIFINKFILLFFFIFSISLFNSCQHLKKGAVAPVPQGANDDNYYSATSSEAELYEQVPEIDDDFENILSIKDDKLLEDMLEKNKIDLTFSSSYDIPIEINPQVIRWIQYFQTTGRKHFEVWLERGKTFIPYIRQVLKENDMPEDLAFLSMIESGFSNIARSRAGAVGAWQFMPRTARNYGLKVDWWVDERRDLEKSTIAAIKYLRFLHKKFDDWYLAMAAYNAGEGKIGRAIKKYNTNNYWELSKYRYIRSETKNYVPKTIATALIVKNLKNYGFEEISFNESFPELKSVTIEKQSDLFKIAKYIGTEYNTLKKLNPALLRWSTPPNHSNYILKIPVESDDIKIASLPEMLRKDPTSFRRHVVARGDNLWNIASKYGTNVQSIKNINRLVSNNIIIGQSLEIPMGFQNPRVQTEPSRNPSRVWATKINVNEALENESNTDGTFAYVIKRGDSIWTIAKQFNVTPDSIKRLNPHLRKRSSRIFPGQSIQIPISNERTVNTISYIVKRGDTISRIAARFKVSPVAIKGYNPQLERRNSTIFPGEAIDIPLLDQRSMESLPVIQQVISHTVRRGDTLYSIARRYSTTVSTIANDNNLRSSTIKPGETIIVRNVVQ